MTRPARSLVFDGTNEYGTFVSSSALSFERTDAFSIGIWFKTTTTNFISVLVAKMGDSPSFTGYMFCLTSAGGVRFDLINNAATTNHVRVDTVATGFNDGAWHHAVVTYSGASAAAGVALYVDGIAEADSDTVDSLSSSIVTSSIARVGARQTSGDERYFPGNLAHAAVWDRVLTAAEVFEAYNLGWPRDLDTHSASANLVGWWPLGEVGTWPYVLDLSGSENTLKLVNMETGDISTDVPEGPLPYSTKSLVFDGVDEYVTFGNVLDFERTDAFSISCWIKASAIGTIRYLVSKKGGSPGWWLGHYSTGDIGFTFWVDGVNRLSFYSTTKPVGLNEWAHVVLTYDGSSSVSGCNIYINGAVDTLTGITDNLTSNISSTAALMLADRQEDLGTGSFVGNLNEVSIYDKELSAAEVEWLFNNGAPPLSVSEGAPSNLVGYWRCGDNDSSPTITDLSISGNNGTMTNMEATDIQGDVPTPLPTVCSAKSLLFDGVNEYVTMGNVLDKERTDTFSISCWFKTTTTTTGILVSKALNVGPKGTYLRLGGGSNPQFYLTANATNYAVVGTTGTYNDGKWHHCVATNGGTGTVAGMRVYVDGVDVTSPGTDNLAGLSISNTGSLTFGARDGTGDIYEGGLDEVGIYGKELSPTEVAWLYNGGRPRGLREPDAPSNLVGWWRCGDGDTFPTLTDNSVNSNNGTMTNMEAADIVPDVPLLTTRLLPSTKSLSFNGTDEYVTMGNVLDKSSSSTFSVSYWFKSSAASTQYLVSKFDATPIGWGTGLLSSGEMFAQLYFSGTLRALVQTVITGFDSGTWHHVVATFDGSGTAAGIKIYVGGVDQVLEVASDTLGANNVSNTGPFNISGYNNGTALLNGNADEVAVYGKVLSQAEVNWLFNNGQPVSPYAPDAPSSLEAWWRCGDGDTSPTVLDNTVNGYNGTMTNMDASNIVDDAPVPDYPALLVEEDAPIPAEISVNTDGALSELGADEFPNAATQYYRMRGWNTVSLDWELWTSTGAPNLTPPVGPCVNIQVQVVWD